MKVHFISGLGADERVFQYLVLPEVDRIYIKWITPYKDESMLEYTKRLLPQVDLSEPLVLVGVSFGGLIAQEMAQLLPCHKVILVSSARSPQAYDWRLKLVRQLKLHKLATATFLKWSSKYFADYFFSVANKEESRLLHQVIQDTDDTFLLWAIDQIMRWEPKGSLPNVVQIHGANDRLFDAGKTTQATIVSDTGHFFFIGKSEKTSAFLRKELAKQ